MLTEPRRLLVKIGGAQLERDDARADLAASLAAARADGHQVIVVHGGGNQIRDLGQRLALVDRYHEGLRVTDAATAELVLMVLGGLVNRRLVQSLQAAGIAAAGLTGADGATFTVEKHTPGGVDLGYVGAVRHVDGRLVQVLLHAGFVPVIGTVAPLAADVEGARDQLYNVNADMAAGPLAAALHADALLFLTDVPGVLDTDRHLVPRLTPAACAVLRATGALSGGMLPKVAAAVHAVHSNPRCLVKIAAAAGRDAVRAALGDRAGTTFCCDADDRDQGGNLPVAASAQRRPDRALTTLLLGPPEPRAPAHLDTLGETSPSQIVARRDDSRPLLPMDEHVLRTYVRPEPVFVSGQGARLRDADGKEYVDFLGGIAVSALGHAHPRLIAELHDQLHKLVHVSNLYRHPYTEQVAARLAALSGMTAVFFTNSGAEANEAALKIARRYHHDAGAGHRTGFVALTGSFHGRTFGALSVTHSEKYRKPFAPLLPGVTFVAPDDVDGLGRALASAPAALILEPIQGESGVRAIAPAFVRAARELCDRTGTLLIHDEVQCGSGRTGTFLYGEQLGVKPDLATLAKPIAAGLPMGCCLVGDRLVDTLQPGDHGSTFAGGPLVLRAALVFLDELEQGLLATVRRRGAQLRRGLEALQRDFPIVSELRGHGLIQGLRLSHGATELHQILFGLGLLVNVAGGDVIRLLPPYVITDVELARGLQLLRDGLQQLGSGAPAAGAAVAAATPPRPPLQ